jgi:hypothetical protein
MNQDDNSANGDGQIDWYFLNDNYQRPKLSEGFLASANQPKYLGSPTVVLKLIQTVVASAFEHAEGKISFYGVWNTVWEMSQQIVEGADYARVPDWHTCECLGQALRKAFQITPNPTREDDLSHYVSEAFMTLYLKVRELLIGFTADPGAALGLHLLPQISKLQQWATAVFIGKNNQFYPGLQIDDFVWEVAASSVY